MSKTAQNVKHVKKKLNRFCKKREKLLMWWCEFKSGQTKHKYLGHIFLHQSFSTQTNKIMQRVNSWQWTSQKYLKTIHCATQQPLFGNKYFCNWDTCANLAISTIIVGFLQHFEILTVSRWRKMVRKLQTFMYAEYLERN